MSLERGLAIVLIGTAVSMAGGAVGGIVGFVGAALPAATWIFLGGPQADAAAILTSGGGVGALVGVVFALGSVCRWIAGQEAS